MVRQKSGAMSSPTPSIDSLNGALAFCDNSDHGLDSYPHTFSSSGVSSATSSSSSLDRASTGSASSSSGLSTSPLGGGNFTSCNTKCSVCNSTFLSPKVLPCFHTFCQACLERTQEHTDKITCPTCQSDCQLGPQGVAGLLVDYGVSSSDPGLDMAGCTGCKSRESSAVARCFDCSNFLCANCVMAHQFMHCFEGHHVTTLGEITNNSGTHHVQELDAVNKMISEGKIKANEIRNNLKNLETTSTRLAGQYQKALSEVNETYQFYVSMLDERRAEIARELEQAYSSKQVALSVYSQKAQETVDKIFQVTEFVERLMKHASNGEVLLFKKPLDARLHQLLSYTPELNMGSITELEFISNFQAIQVGVKNQFGYVKSKPESGGANKQQPPISRPVPSPLPQQQQHQPSQQLQQQQQQLQQHEQLSSMVRGLLEQRCSSYAGNQFETASLLSKRFNSSSQIHHHHNTNSHHNNHQSQSFHQQGAVVPSSSNSSSNNSSAHLNSTNSSHHLQSSNSHQHHHQMPPSTTSHLSSILNGSSIAELTSSGSGGGSSGSSGGQSLGSIGGSSGLGSAGLNPYEKWSNGDSLFGFTSQPSQDRLSMSQPPSDMIDITSKFMSSATLSPSPMAAAAAAAAASASAAAAAAAVSSPPYPPKSQIKRQKMIYHCKFGEFGILEGQFTEPSGVAVNAQNDIIVADTNNHRIQIFDKEGRFKFQFGEVGKRDGQLLYPNRVAVVKTSGDIIVTERSPTHQIQIYNQYGQFVRKFGANILQHPRGVCVDNKGRIVVVECKVMRVIIFDQFGNVLNKFGCSKHLEFPNGVVVNDRQEIFISDNRAHCVKVFDYEGNFLRQIGGEGITNYPIGVGINGAGEITIADNHNNFNLSVFSQEGQLISALESKVKHAQCFDVSLMDDGSVVLASKDYRLYIYRYIQVPPLGI